MDLPKLLAAEGLLDNRIGKFLLSLFEASEFHKRDEESLSGSASSSSSNLRYLLLIPILTLSYPLIATLIFAFFSASAWVFWIVTSFSFGVLQLIYVVYQFLMISIDVIGLSLLKSYALLRSRIRAYAINSGISKSTPGFRRRGQRRVWAQKLRDAHSYAQYSAIAIEEPIYPTDPQHHSSTSHNAIFRFLPNPSKISKPQGGKPPLPPRSQRTQPLPNDTTSNPHGPIMPRPKSLAKMQGMTSIKHKLPQSSLQSTNPTPKSKNNNNNSLFTTASSISRFFLPRPMSSDNFLSSAHNNNNNNNNKSSDSSTYDDATTEEERSLRKIEHEIGMTGGMLLTTTSRLREARKQAMSEVGNKTKTRFKIQETMSSSLVDCDDSDEEGLRQDDSDALSSLKFLLSGVVKRNHLSIDDLLIHDARAIAERGVHGLGKEARNIVLRFNEEVEQCLHFLAEAEIPYPKNLPQDRKQQQQSMLPWHLPQDCPQGHHRSNSSSRTSGSPPSSVHQNMEDFSNPTDFAIRCQATELSDRINFMRRLKHNMGRTGLMLSGGGAQAMYHVGTIRALVEAGLYDDIPVISGTSGGSITAAMCALKTPEELLEHVCVNTVSTDYMLTGQMKRENIRWFPKLIDMGAYWMKHKLLVDSAEFKRCCDFYFGDWTFEEAHERTGKHVCITVLASRGGGNEVGAGNQRLLLNHISTPHVTLSRCGQLFLSLWPAVLCLVLVAKPTKLITKNRAGKQEPFEVDGVEWIDGSVQADIPFKRIAAMFN